MTLSVNKNVSNYVSEGAVRLIPAPEWTPTWHPVSHATLLDAVAEVMAKHGIGIVNKHFSMNKSGTKLFAAYDLDLGDGKIGYCLGFRHGIDKSLKISFVGGTRVFVCDNLCLFGDFITTKMHSPTLDYGTLKYLVHQALRSALRVMQQHHEWHLQLHNIYVPQPDFKQLVFDMVAKGVFAGGQINNYLSCLEEEKKIYHGTNLDRTTSLYAVHGAATRLMRPWNLLRTAETTPKLKAICDDYIAARAA